MRCVGGSTAPRMNLLTNAQDQTKSGVIPEEKEASLREGTYLRSTAPSTNSVRMTVVLWYATTDHES